MVAAHPNLIDPNTPHRHPVSQANALHHHNQLMEAIGAATHNFEIQINFGGGQQRI